MEGPCDSDIWSLNGLGKKLRLHIIRFIRVFRVPKLVAHSSSPVRLENPLIAFEMTTQEKCAGKSSTRNYVDVFSEQKKPLEIVLFLCKEKKYRIITVFDRESCTGRTSVCWIRDA